MRRRYRIRSAMIAVAILATLIAIPIEIARQLPLWKERRRLVTEHLIQSTQLDREAAHQDPLLFKILEGAYVTDKAIHDERNWPDPPAALPQPSFAEPTYRRELQRLSAWHRKRADEIRYAYPFDPGTELARDEKPFQRTASFRWWIGCVVEAATRSY